MNNLRFLLLFLSIPALLCAQQNKPLSNVPAPAAASTTTQPAVANPKTPEEFFARARQLSDLEAAGIPFHLKATYVATGNTEFTGNGTFEEWWQSKDVWRKEATLADYKWVKIKNGDTTAVYASASYMPLRVQQMLNSVLIHIDPDVGNSQDWKLERKKLKGIDFAILTKVNDCGLARRNLKCFAQDFFTNEGVLRIHVNEASEKLYNNIQAFHGLLIPHKVTLTLDEDTILDIALTILEPLSPNEITLSKDAPLPAIPRMSPAKKFRTGSHIAPSKLIHRVNPVYPVEDQQLGIEGTVVLAAIIDTEGKVVDLDVLHSLGPLLDKAALKAVRDWRYRPTTIDGTPVAVETTISVVFEMNH